MLITHHTVINEQLPCKLIFADWDMGLLKGTPIICYNNNTLNSSIASTLRECKASSIKNDEICLNEQKEYVEEEKRSTLSNISNTNTESLSSNNTLIE